MLRKRRIGNSIKGTNQPLKVLRIYVRYAIANKRLKNKNLLLLLVSSSRFHLFGYFLFSEFFGNFHLRSHEPGENSRYEKDIGIAHI